MKHSISIATILFGLAVASVQAQIPTATLEDANLRYSPTQMATLIESCAPGAAPSTMLAVATTESALHPYLRTVTLDSTTQLTVNGIDVPLVVSEAYPPPRSGKFSFNERQGLAQERLWRRVSIPSSCCVFAHQIQPRFTIQIYYPYILDLLKNDKIA
jgi:hypothetical protein